MRVVAKILEKGAASEEGVRGYEVIERHKPAQFERFEIGQFGGLGGRFGRRAGSWIRFPDADGSRVSNAAIGKSVKQLYEQTDMIRMNEVVLIEDTEILGGDGFETIP